MKVVSGEKILVIVVPKRKGRSGDDQTPFELGIGVVLNEKGVLTGEVRLRTEQISCGVAPVVGTLDVKMAEQFRDGLTNAIAMAKLAPKPTT